MSRVIPHTTHAAAEILGGAALTTAPFALGFGRSATFVCIALGAIAIATAIQIGGPARRISFSAHASFDYLLATVAIVAGMAIGLATGEWRATIFLVGVGAAQVALTASTRWSVPAGV